MRSGVQEHLHVYLYKADYRAVEESGYEEDDEGGGCGPQAADLIFLQAIICAVHHENRICR